MNIPPINTYREKQSSTPSALFTPVPTWLRTVKMSLYTVKAIVLLESSGERLVAKYYPGPEDTAFANPKAQETFEAKLFAKTTRQNSEVVQFDGYTVVYKTRSDVSYYVIGAEDENELILLTALNTLRDTLDILLSSDAPDAQIDQQRLLENLDFLLLVIDELVDGGIIMETDPQVLAERVALKGPDDDDLPITEQTVSQVIDQASEFARSFMGFY